MSDTHSSKSMLEKTAHAESYEPAFEVHLTDVILFFSKYIVLLVIVGASAGIFGYLLSDLVTKKFTAKTVLLSEYSSTKSSFFSLAMGANSGDGPGNLTPELYPNVLESSSFGEFLIQQPITDQSGKRYKTLRDYIKRDTTVSFLARVRSFFLPKPKASKPGRKLDLGNPDVINYSSDEQGLVSSAKSMVSASIEPKNGLISIESELPDGVVAALLVEYAKNYLIDYIEDFRTAKLDQQLKFVSSRAVEAKARLNSAEYALQSYRDRNRNAFLNVARIEEQRLQAEYTLAQSIYSDLVIKQEQLGIKVKEERPVFKVLEPTKVPLGPSSPNRLLYAVVLAGVGLFSCLMYIFIIREKFHLRLMKR